MLDQTLLCLPYHNIPSKDDEQTNDNKYCNYLPQAFQEYAEKPLWVGFQVQVGTDGKTKKLPISPNDFNLASINDSTTWGTFTSVIEMINKLTIDSYSNYNPNYIGFALTKEDNLIFSDLDHVRNTNTGDIEE